MTEAALDKEETLFTSKLNLNVSKKLVPCCILSIAFYGVDTWTLRKMDQNYRESSEMFRRSIERNSWTDRAISEMIQKIEKGLKFLNTTKQRKDNWTGQIFHRNFLLKHAIEGKIEGTGRRRRRCKQLLDGIKEK